VTVDAELTDGHGPPRYYTQTYQVALNSCSSPTHPNVAGGKAKAGQPIPARKTHGVGHQCGAQIGGRAQEAWSITALGVDEDEDEWSPQNKSQGRRRRTKPPEPQQSAKSPPPESGESIEEHEDMYGAGFGTTENAPDQSNERNEREAKKSTRRAPCSLTPT
jgi:hypothetical protein